MRLSRTYIIANQLRRFPFARLLRFARGRGASFVLRVVCIYIYMCVEKEEHVGNEGGAVDTETDRIIEEEVFCSRWRRGACSTSVRRWRFLYRYKSRITKLESFFSFFLSLLLFLFLEID